MKATSSATDSRGIMGLARAISIAAVLSFSPAAPGDVAGRGSLGDRQAGALLESVINHHQNGELERAWEAYRAFFDHPSSRNVDIEVFNRCFFRQECPSLGALAYVLGKSEAEAGAFRNFCPDWKDAERGDLSADEAAEVDGQIRAFRDTALGGTCQEWVTRMAAQFEPRPSARQMAPQVVPLKWPFPHDSTPVSEVEILGKRVNAWLDTGATMTTLNRRWVDQAPDALDLIQNIRVKYIEFRGEATMARVRRIQLGNAVLSKPVVLLTGVYFSNNGELAPAERGNLIGMNLLLQYERVCFDWEGRKLYLGNLGPCEGGMTPYRNWLTGPFGLTLRARISSIDYVDAKIDTGSTTTYCSEWLMEQNTEREAFSFGSNEILTGECTYNPETLFIDQEQGTESPGRHILVGMDTLRKFAAFGWQLNPLVVYFSPGSPDTD